MLCNEHRNLNPDYGDCAPLHAQVGPPAKESYLEKEGREQIRKLRTRLNWARNEQRWNELYGRRIKGPRVASVEGEIDEIKLRLSKDGINV